MNDSIHSGIPLHSDDSSRAALSGRRSYRIRVLLPGFAGAVSCLGLVHAEAPVQQLDTMTVSETRDKNGNIIDYRTEKAAAATKTDTPLIETPQSISVITEDQLELRNAKTVTEALRYTAGTSTETYGQDPRG
ncbi:MAG: TonB-dependent siderophore receptor family protein 12, partial [Akkermansiaceae bacterium]|nr:TonB-dependent siderophore receptor family protein 12 [Akkermansiaceae bacterium]